MCVCVQKLKISWFRYRLGVARKVGTLWLYSSMTAALERGEWSVARPGRILSPGKNRYPFYRRLGGPRGRSGRAENLVPPGFDHRTVQPVAQSLCRLSHPAHIYPHTHTHTHTHTLKIYRWILLRTRYILGESCGENRLRFVFNELFSKSVPYVG